MNFNFCLKRLTIISKGLYHWNINFCCFVCMRPFAIDTILEDLRMKLVSIQYWVGVSSYRKLSWLRLVYLHSTCYFLAIYPHDKRFFVLRIMLGTEYLSQRELFYLWINVLLPTPMILSCLVAFTTFPSSLVLHQIMQVILMFVLYFQIFFSAWCSKTHYCFENECSRIRGKRGHWTRVPNNVPVE